jgi:hypothetical protein
MESAIVALGPLGRDGAVSRQGGVFSPEQERGIAAIPLDAPGSM